MQKISWLSLGLIVCCCLWTVSNAQVFTNGALGSIVNVLANTDTVIQFSGGIPSLQITTSVQTVVILSQYSKFTPLPAGIVALDFGGWNGYNLTVIPDSVNGVSTTLSATLIAPTPVALDPPLDPATYAALLYSPANADYSQLIGNAAAIFTNGSFFVDLSSSSFIIFATIAASTPIPTFYGEMRLLTQNIRSKYSYRYELILDLTPTADTPLTVDFSTNIVGALTSSQSNYVYLNSCFVIGLSAPVSANVIFTYNSGIVSDFRVSEASLVFGFETTSSGSYSFMSGTQVNITALTMTQSFPSIESSGIGIFGTSSAATLAPSVLLLIISALLMNMF